MRTISGFFWACGSLAVLVSACSGSDTLSGVGTLGGSSSSATGGVAAEAGTGLGGATGQGGANTGGATIVGQGGALATGGMLATGGTNAPGATGGTKASGGAVATGGVNATGGNVAATGGTKATGGMAPTTGGTKATGGTNAATGGAVATGGTKATGGTAPTGGAKATGGMAPTGGAKATGGMAPTGGSKATGGSTGNTGLGTWTTGYVATMYGNYQSGDCSGYSNFTDTTNINSQTCPNVQKATFQSGTANNAAYYGATGDLSSLWVGTQCVCQNPPGGTGDCPSGNYPSCPTESQSGGNCGICVAVKCDPNGTFSYGGTTNDTRCNTTTYVVVQIIDACPHNHPTNVASQIGWCTSRQANHIDLSCSGLGDISTLGTGIGQAGWLNVDVQQVNCNVGLGKHSL